MQRGLFLLMKILKSIMLKSGLVDSLKLDNNDNHGQKRKSEHSLTAKALLTATAISIFPVFTPSQTSLSTDTPILLR
jgi:hypothetical protein